MADLGAAKFNEGYVEGWLEGEVKDHRDGAERILEAFRLYVRAYDDLLIENRALANRLDSIQKVLANQ